LTKSGNNVEVFDDEEGNGFLEDFGAKVCYIP
jgi:hypothetical protein